MIIQILLFIVFLILLAKAIYETIWGICLIIHGLFWHAVGYSLDAIVIILRTYKKITRKFRKQPEPPKFSMARAIALHYRSSK